MSGNEIGLSEKSMKIIYDIFAQFQQIEKVILYGSRAMGNFREGSDIDMTIIADETFSYDDLLKLNGMFSDSYLPYFVDLSIFSKLQNTSLIEHINRKGKLLYEKQNHKSVGEF